MSTPLLLPSSRLVVAGWLQLAVPGVGIDTKLPTMSDTLRANGFIRMPIVGGTPDSDIPWRSPVVAAECWWPPPLRGEFSHWNRAEQLAERVVAATFDPDLMGRVVDLSTVGNYGSARVHDVTALSEPDPVEEDPNDWARFDVDLLINWTGV